MEESGITSDIFFGLSGYFDEKLIMHIIVAKVASTFMESVIYPLIDIYLIDKRKFSPLNVYIDKDTKTVECKIDTTSAGGAVKRVDLGYLLREILVFVFLYAIVYFFIK